MNYARRALYIGLLLATLIGTHAYAESLIPQSERRSAEQTYLTYPEWFLVHSPAEYAELIKAHPAYDFPFLSHIVQLWGSYAAVAREQWREDQPANAGYHAMILVIAGSTTIEYALRSLYENTVGRASHLFSSGELTREETLGAEVAQQYVDFIRREPWYLFDFASALKRLWSDVPLWGGQPLRKLERRYALTTEYLIKGLYAKLIEITTRAAYEEAKMTTWTVVNGLPMQTKLPATITLQSDLNADRAVLVLPRYEAFKQDALWLARQGANFTDIAGNDGKILVSLITPQAWVPEDPSTILFSQPILTHPDEKRVALALPVSRLSSALLAWDDAHLRVEHIYDY